MLSKQLTEVSEVLASLLKSPSAGADSTDWLAVRQLGMGRLDRWGLCIHVLTLHISSKISKYSWKYN